MEAELWIPLITVPILFIFLPWLIFHYVTKWKANSSLTQEDENMLDDLYDLARRLDDRMSTIERIVADENPSWNALASERAALQLERQEVESLGTRRSKATTSARRGRA